MWFINLLIGLAFQIIGYLIAPRPKAAKPPTVKDMDNPTSESGRPIPVVFGTITVKGLNFLWYGEKVARQYSKRESSGKKK